MKIFVATDINIVICQNNIYARSKYSTILKRYHNAFGKIVLCARFENADSVTAGYEDISDIVCSIVKISSLTNMLLNRCASEMKKGMADCGLVVVRCPSLAAYRAADMAKKLGIPYFAESMGCAWDAYWNHSLVGKTIAPYMFFKMKSVVKHADYALYVTSEFLQKRYPSRCDSIGASNVLINDINDDILQKRLEKIRNMNTKEITLMTTAAVNVKYKGQQYVIKAIPLLNKMGIKVKYNIVGEGDSGYLQRVANKYNVADQVCFVGQLPLNKVFEYLDETDIYIQPSLQEGLPRSIIEAMSRGCPVIGANTAGIPELIAPKCVVKRKSVSNIVKTISQISNVKIMEEFAKQNFLHSKEYVESVLNARRDNYFSSIIMDLSKYSEDNKH